MGAVREVRAVLFEGLEEGVGEEVAEELVAGAGEVDAVLLAEVVGRPFSHGVESAHDGELVPDHAAALLGDTHERIADKRAVVVDRIVAFDATVAVVVGDEDEGAVRAYGTDGVDELEITLAEESRVVVGARGVVDADAEDNKVWFGEMEVGSEVGAFCQVVGHGGTVDADGVVGDAGESVLEEDAGEGEGLAAVAGQEDSEGIDRIFEAVDIAAVERVDRVGSDDKFAIVEERDYAAARFAEEGDTVGGELEFMVVEGDADMGSGVGGRYGDAREA